MSTNNYHQQKIKMGSRLIADKIVELARHSDIAVTRVEWDGGRLNATREDYHTLTVYTNDTSIHKTFYDEELADFPYESADTIQKVQNLIRDLKA